MLSFALAMTTAPRPEPYIHRAYRSLRAAGFTEPLHLFAEPGSELLREPGDVVVHPNSERLGCFFNWKQALHYLLDCDLGRWLLLLQDDCVFRKDAAERLRAGCAAIGSAETGFLSPYTSAAMLPGCGNPGYPLQEGWLKATFYNNAFWGALALCVPAGAALQLRYFPRFEAHEHHRKVDVLVGNCFRDMGRAMYVHYPSLADHIGAFSTLGRHKIPGIQWGRRGFQFREHAEDKET